MVFSLASCGDDENGDENNGGEGTGDENNGGEGTGNENNGGEGTGDENNGGEGTGNENNGGEGAGNENNGGEGAGNENNGGEGTGDENNGAEGTACEHEYNLVGDPISTSTCSTQGRSQLRCSKCGDECILLHPLVPENHVYPEEWTVTVEAECNSVGSREKECIECHKPSAKIVEEIPMIAHANLHITSPLLPTAQRGGATRGVYCLDCQTVIEEQKPLPKLSNITSQATFSISDDATMGAGNGTCQNWANWNPAFLYDGDIHNGTRSPKGGQYSIFVDFDVAYVTDFTLTCNGGGSVQFGTITDPTYAIKKLKFFVYDQDGNRIYDSREIDTSNSLTAGYTFESGVFISRIEIQIIGGGHGGGEYLWELEINGSTPTE